MRTITLVETHCADGRIYHQWCLFSRKHFLFKRISCGAYYKLWTMLACRSYTFKCLPCEKHGGYTVFKTEFTL